MPTDLERAFAAITAKRDMYATYYRYYNGDQPTAYTTRRLRELFRGVDAVFTENWCHVVVRTSLNRLHLDALGARDEGLAAQLAALWDEHDGDLISAAMHEDALVTGEGYIIAWRDDDGIEIAANQAAACHVFYDAERPQRKRFAAKMWVADDETARMVLYYPERIEYYATSQKAADVAVASAFTMSQEPAVNPFGMIPVFHFRTAFRAPRSELVDVIPLQNGINKLAADMMVAAEYGAFKQRYVISQMDTVGKLRNAPNEIWSLPASDGVGQPTTVGEFSSTDLNNYLTAIENLANTLSTISATPKHYFFQRGGIPSGEALIVEESPLVAKVQRFQRIMTPEWQQLGAFLALISAGQVVNPRLIVPQYTPAEMVQPRMSAEILQMRVAAGLPLTTALRLEGYSQAEIDAIMAEREEEQRRRQATLGQAMLEAERRRDALKALEDM